MMTPLEPEHFFNRMHATPSQSADTNQCLEREYGGDRSGRACLQFCRGNWPVAASNETCSLHR